MVRNYLESTRITQKETKSHVLMRMSRNQNLRALHMNVEGSRAPLDNRMTASRRMLTAVS